MLGYKVEGSEGIGTCSFVRGDETCFSFRTKRVKLGLMGFGFR